MTGLESKREQRAEQEYAQELGYWTARGGAELDPKVAYGPYRAEYLRGLGRGYRAWRSLGERRAA